MIHEQISLNGRHTVGFGDATSETKQSVFVPPLVGFLVGSIGGAVLGSLVEKGVGTAVGTIAGGIGGAGVGLVVGYHLAHPTGATAATTPAPSTGEVYTIGLSGVPDTATVEDVGRALAQAMAWNMDTIEDGSLDRNPQGAMLTVAFKYNTTTPPLPSVGFSFKIDAVYVNVISVTRAPVKVQ